MILARYRGRLLFSLALAVLVLLGLLVYGDLTATVRAIGRFRLEFVPAIIGLTLLNYLLRFGKWHYYLRRLGARDLTLGTSLLVFLSGMSMTVTPGKVGEWLKCYLLQQQGALSFSRAAPVVLAERLTDGLALLVLASGGMLIFGLGGEVLAGTLLLAAVIVGLSQYRPLARWVLERAATLPILGRQAAHLREFYESSFLLFRGPALAVAVGLGVISWAGECLAFALVLTGLGVEPSSLLVVQATFILAISSLAGGLLLTPGGLGVAEGGIAGLTRYLVGTSPDVAAAATILIRACTLWFGVLLGAVALAITSRQLARRPSAALTPRPDAAVGEA
ncbi:MAG: flippase-like domain-containing protein [Chloroflexi bacterium]|nr:flippase-like domain-containing protein [Chloroflexota bacterium]GIW09936.1 MAG: TIGR00374 family protein [Dehalococcoidia bacterium]